MSRWRLAAGTSIASLALALGGCGGGGGGGPVSTPPPAPSPAPAPAPAPAPTPTPTNPDLLRPLVTESFSNKAALGTGSFPTDGSAPTRTAAAASLTVRYDAATDSYTITNGARSQTFRQSDVTTQDAVQRIYTRTAGSTTDTLLLTEPGTSGALTYQYVGSGSWQRTVQGASTVNATVDAFVYGAPTPAGNVPSSGSAGFAVDLIGTAGPTSYAGDGQLSVDFARGELLLDIEVNEIMDGGAVNPFAQRFSGNGAIASGNAFSGSFRLPFFEQYSGTFNGQFFGPASEEVGAAFFGTGTLPGSAIVGTIMGRRGGSATNTNLLNLNSDQQFAARVTDIFLAEAISDKRPLDFFTPSRTAATLHYDADTRSFRYQQAGAWDVTFEEPSRSISPDGRFILFDAGGGQTLALYRPGPDNSQLQLTYASFGAFRRNFDEPAFDRRGFGYDYFAYGITTAAMPTSGSASYSGIVVGQGVSSRAHYDLAGSTDLDVNFAGGGLTGTLSIAGVERQLGRTVNFGTFAFTGAVDRLAATLTGSSADGFGSIDGSFFGPAAVEFAATFAGFRGTDASLPGNIVHMGGALVGKKD